jgi:hypothetical protein
MIFQINWKKKLLNNKQKKSIQNFKDLKNERNEYIPKFKDSKNRFFPFRYFTDINDNVLPIVAVTGFFRDKHAEDLFYEYKEYGIHIFGITAYKSFPNRDMMDMSEGEYERTDIFNYTEKIKDWLCCFRNKEKYGFTSENRVVDISESDFYNAEPDTDKYEKKYDFIYICGKDSDECPMEGWNAFNRNFKLALKCLPIMINEFNMKGVVIGRVNCGLEEKYGDKIQVIEWLDWHLLQDKMKECKFLFVPNIYDASPRVVAECITKDLQVLMNNDILCGYKYINDETGEFFTDEYNIKDALTKLVNKMGKVSPKKWWEENYSQAKSQKKLRDFLHESFPDILEKVELVRFIL